MAVVDTGGALAHREGFSLFRKTPREKLTAVELMGNVKPLRKKDYSLLTKYNISNGNTKND